MNFVRFFGGMCLYAAGYVGASTDGWDSALWILGISLLGWIVLDKSVEYDR